MKKIFIIISLLFYSNHASAESALFSDAKIQAKYLTWNIFKTKRGRRDICYIISKPVDGAGAIYKRGDPYFVVTKIKNNADEINIVSGFEYKENFDPEISFGQRKFYLQTHMNRAWTNSRKDDIEIIKEMQKNEEVIFTSSTKDDFIISDTYSLIGFRQAYFKMRKLCQ